MRNELGGKVEELSGQPVRAIIAGTELEPDISTQIFVLGECLADQGEEGERELSRRLSRAGWLACRGACPGPWSFRRRSSP